MTPEQIEKTLDYWFTGEVTAATRARIRRDGPRNQRAIDPSLVQRPARTTTPPQTKKEPAVPKPRTDVPLDIAAARAAAARKAVQPPSKAVLRPNQVVDLAGLRKPRTKPVAAAAVPVRKPAARGVPLGAQKHRMRVSKDVQFEYWARVPSSLSAWSDAVHDLASAGRFFCVAVRQAGVPFAVDYDTDHGRVFGEITVDGRQSPTVQDQQVRRGVALLAYQHAAGRAWARSAAVRADARAFAEGIATARTAGIPAATALFERAMARAKAVR